MITFSAPRLINKWRPPGYGPSNPKRRNLRTNSRHDTLLGIPKGMPRPRLNAQTRNRISVPQLEQHPVLKRRLQFTPATFKGLCICPHAPQSGNLPVISPVTQHFIGGSFQLLCDKFAQHEYIISVSYRNRMRKPVAAAVFQRHPVRSKTARNEEPIEAPSGVWPSGAMSRESLLKMRGKCRSKAGGKGWMCQ